MKTNTTTKATTIEANTVNPFEELSATNVAAAQQGRKLAFTDVLNHAAMERSAEAIMSASKNPELFPLANAMMDSGDPADLLKLFEATGVLEKVSGDAAALDGCDEETLKRMLESRRSDRSKNKKKGVRSSIAVCRAYVASFYAELVVREAMGKPYTGATGKSAIVVDTADVDAVNRKIKSLQSKKCRVSKLAQAGDAAAQKELDEVVAEIERLQAFRPTVATKTVVKSIKVDELRAALAKLDPNDVPDEVRDLLTKIG